MEIKEYEVMYDIEEDYWWYIGLRKLVLSYLNGTKSDDRKLKILDAGCGTGKLLEDCNSYGAYGLDFSEEALRFCKLRNLKNMLRASISHIPFKDDSFDLVTSFDVICCLDVHYDMVILKELYRITNKNGILLLNLPAYNFLQSTHDRAVHIKHRYFMSEVKRKVEKAGFVIERITYRNTFLFPIAFTVRVLKKMLTTDMDKSKSDLQPLPRFLNKILTYTLLLENKLIVSGVSFPFGLSIFCVARKKLQKI